MYCTHSENSSGTQQLVDLHYLCYEQGAFWGLMVGLVIGLVRFAWESAYGQSPCGEDNGAPSIITSVHYLHFGIMLFVIVSMVTIVISLLTEQIDDKHVSS